MMKAIIILTIALFNFYALAQKQNSSVEKVFYITQKRKICNKGLYLQLKKAFNDSRCPEEAQCIWAGEVSVEINVYRNKKCKSTKTLTFNSKNASENNKWFSDLYQTKIKAVYVYPNLKIGTVVKPEDYLVKVIY